MGRPVCAMIALRWVLNCARLRPPDFTHHDYPGIYMDQDFHHCGLQPNDTIVNYDNEVEVWTCEVGGLAECASEVPGPFLVTTLTCRRTLA